MSPRNYIFNNIYKHSYSKCDKDAIISESSSILYPKDEDNKKINEDYYRKNRMVTFKEKYDKNGNIISVTTYITPYPNQNTNSNIFTNFSTSLLDIIDNISNYFNK